MGQCTRYRVVAELANGEDWSLHSLTVRLKSKAVVSAVQSAADELTGSGGFSIWHERVPVPWDDPAARARARQEARRPLQGTRRSLRVVLLTYADGPADLVLVARRAVYSGASLRSIALSLSQARRHVLPPGSTSADTPPAAGAGTPPEWGLGDATVGGRWGEIAIPVSVPAPPDALLIAATAVTVARHSGSGEPAVAVWPSAEDTDNMWVYRVDCEERQQGGDLLRACQRAVVSDAPGDARLPSVGIVFAAGHAGECHRPFLAPPLPLLLHWQRAADATVRGTLSYRERDIAPEIARDFAGHLANVTRQLAATPDRALRDVDVMPPAETARLLERGTTPGATVPGGTIHGALAAVARDHPDAVAVADEKTELTYAELDQRAARLARGLAAAGVVPGSLVAVALDRTAELVVTLLGILKAGCAYVPVDVRYPPERLRYIVEQAGAPVAVASPGTLARIRGVRPVAPEELYDIGERGDLVPPPAGGGSGPAYVIYTSGSTGRPKGVVVPHSNVLALVAATRADFALGPHDTWTFFHSCAFDFSVWEIWGCLLTGGRLVVVPYWAARDTGLFYDLVDRRRVTVLNQTPSAFAQFAEADARYRASLALRLVVFGGEALDLGLLGPWFTRHSNASCRVVNMFGITETTVHVTAQTITPSEVTAGHRTVGRALPGWSLSVRDSHGKVLPAGAAGEVYVGGVGVALGYLHQPDLTAERFISDPHGHGRLYRSGDLGRIRPDGRLDHLGRIDSQVKIRGYRIEFDEIRGVLLGHPAVAAAAVMLRYGVPGDRDTARIDAYYATRAGSALAEGDLLRHASGFLPDYMLPTTLTRLDAMPLTVNGKIDLAALPPSAAPAPGPPGNAADPAAASVLAVWSRLLNTDVALTDNFFELGGNSLLAIRLLRELRDSGLPRVSLQDFYRCPAASNFIALLRDSEE